VEGKLRDDGIKLLE